MNIIDEFQENKIGRKNANILTSREKNQWLLCVFLNRIDTRVQTEARARK